MCNLIDYHPLVDLARTGKYSELKERVANLLSGTAGVRYTILMGLQGIAHMGIGGRDIPQPSECFRRATLRLPSDDLLPSLHIWAGLHYNQAVAILAESLPRVGAPSPNHLLEIARTEDQAVRLAHYFKGEGDHHWACMAWTLATRCRIILDDDPPSELALTPRDGAKEIGKAAVSLDRANPQVARCWEVYTHVTDGNDGLPGPATSMDDLWMFPGCVGVAPVATTVAP